MYRVDCQDGCIARLILEPYIDGHLFERVFMQSYVVTGAILEREGKILLVKEGSKKAWAHGKWNQPAGWIDIGEDPVESVRREVQEETGLIFRPTDLLGMYSSARRDLAQFVPAGFPHAFKLIFRGDITGGSLCMDGEEIIEQRWFFPEEVEALDNSALRSPDIKQEIRDYFAGISIPLERLHHAVVD